MMNVAANKQKGVITLLTCIVLLFLIFVSSFIVINYLMVMQNQSKDQYQSESVLDAAISGVNYGAGFINSDINSILSKAEGGQLNYSLNELSFDGHSNVLVTISMPVKGNFNLLEIKALAHSDAFEMSRTVRAEFYYDGGVISLPLAQTFSGQYVMIPGSWSDF